MVRQFILVIALLSSCWFSHFSMGQGPVVKIDKYGALFKGELFGHDSDGSARRCAQRQQKTPATIGNTGTTVYDEDLFSDTIGPDAYIDDLNMEMLPRDEDDCSCVSNCDISCGDSVCPSSYQQHENQPLLFLSAEYLYGWTKGANIPILATTSPDNTLQDDAGVLGLSTTDILFGTEETEERGRSGGRFTLGMVLGRFNSQQLEFVYSFLGGSIETFFASDNDISILGRPFFNVDLGELDARLIAFPEFVEGSLDIAAISKFQSFEIHHRKRYEASCWGHVDVLFGYRSNHLDDELTIRETTISLAEPTTGTRIDLVDAFDTDSTFHGAQIGLGIHPVCCGQWSTDCNLKFALGTTSLDGRVSGTTTTTTAASDVSSQSGGLC